MDNLGCGTVWGKDLGNAIYCMFYGKSNPGPSLCIFHTIIQCVGEKKTVHGTYLLYLVQHEQSFIDEDACGLWWLTFQDLNSRQRPKASTDLKGLITFEPLILSVHVNNSGTNAFVCCSEMSDASYLDVHRLRSERETLIHIQSNTWSLTDDSGGRGLFICSGSDMFVKLHFFLVFSVLI